MEAVQASLEAAASEEAGVLGVRAEAPAIEEEENAQTEIAGTKKIVRIENNMIHLSQMPNLDEAQKMNWWWLLVIALFGATGKKMYDNYKANKEDKEEA